MTVSCQTVNGWVPALAARKPSGAARLEHLPQAQQLAGDPRRRGVHARAQLDRRAVGLRGHVLRQLLRQGRQHAVDLLGERPVVGVEQHHLLLRAQRVLVPACQTAHSQAAHAARTQPPPRTRGGLDQRGEERGVLAPRRERLGVPLHAEQERPPRAPRSPRSPRRAPTRWPAGRCRACRRPDGGRSSPACGGGASRGARRLPGAMSTEWVTPAPGAAWRCSRIVPGRSGRCWWSDPPRATLSA